MSTAPIYSSANDIVQAKAELRRTMRAKRRALAQDKGPAAAEALAAYVEQVLGDVSGLVITGYVAIGGEIDPAPALARIAEKGATTGLPVVDPTSDVLEFYAWRAGDPLENGYFGTQQPLMSAPLVEPDVILAPLLAFDSEGNRLGQGAGYYDRTIAALRQTRKIAVYGIAFAGQQVDAVPIDGNDVPIDGILTEDGLITFAPR